MVLFQSWFESGVQEDGQEEEDEDDGWNLLESSRPHSKGGREQNCSHNIYVLGLLFFVPANATAE